MSWCCPKCERVLKNTNQWHYCSQQALDTLFIGKAAQLPFVFDVLLSIITAWDNVNVSATKNCIVFISTQTFLVVKPMKKELDIKFYLPTESKEFPIYKSCIYGASYEHHIRISQTEEVDTQLFTFIKQSYKLKT